MTHLDMDMLKGLPGFKMLLKALIKSQMQLLIEQLSAHAGEDCLVMTVNVSDGAVSQLGSRLGTNFLDLERDIKPRFLGHCLKSGSQLVGKPNYSKSDEECWPATNTHVHGQVCQSASNPSVYTRAAPLSLSDLTGSETSNASITDNITTPVRSGLKLSTSATIFRSNMGTTETIGNVGMPQSQLPEMKLNYNNAKPGTLEMFAQLNSRPVCKDISRLMPEKPDNAVEDNDLVDVDFRVIKVEDDDDTCMSHDDSEVPDYEKDMEGHDTSEQDSVPNTGFGTRFLNPINTTLDSVRKYGKPVEVYKSSDAPKSASLDETSGTSLYSNQKEVSNTLAFPHYGLASGNKQPMAEHSQGKVIDFDSTVSPYKDKSLEETLNKMIFSEGVINKQKGLPGAPRKVFSCDFCMKVFFRKDYLTQHRRVHTKERPYQCAYCDKGFSQKTPMRIHVKRHHNSDVP